MGTYATVGGHRSPAHAANAQHLWAISALTRNGHVFIRVQNEAFQRRLPQPHGCTMNYGSQPQNCGTSEHIGKLTGSLRTPMFSTLCRDQICYDILLIILSNISCI
jgi:hypothetical protein